jgi:hypothetical protein
MEMDECTPYQWCLDNNFRILNLELLEEKWYFTERVTKEDFMTWLSTKTVKANSTPRKTDMYLEYRMYGLVNYQLSGTIHAGIQYGHGVVEYSQSVLGLNGIEDVYNKWARKDKTFIILNGGTTNDSSEYYGGMQKHRDMLNENGVLFSEFREPDLNNALTSVCFLVDERVWNRELYEDFIPETLPWSRQKPSEKKLLELEEKNLKNYKHWEDKIGGSKNAFLRKFLRNFKLA